MTTPYKSRGYNELRRIAKGRGLKQGSHPTTEGLVALLEDDDTHPSYDQWSQEYQIEVLRERNVETDGKSKDELLSLLRDAAPQSTQAAAEPSGTSVETSEADERRSRAGSEDTVIMNPAEKGHREQGDGDGSEDGGEDGGEQFFDVPSTGDASATELKGDEDSQIRKEAVIPSVEPPDDSTIMSEEEFGQASFASSPTSRSHTRFETTPPPIESARTTPGADKSGITGNEGTTTVRPVPVPGERGTTTPIGARAPAPIEHQPGTVTSGSDTTVGEPTAGTSAFSTPKKQQNPVGSSDASPGEGTSEPAAKTSASNSTSRPAASTSAPDATSTQKKPPVRRRARGGFLQGLLASSNPILRPEPPPGDLPRTQPSKPAASTSAPDATSTQKKPPVRRKAKGGLLQELLASSNPTLRPELPQELDLPQVLPPGTANSPQDTWPGTTKFSWKEHFKNVQPVLPYDPFRPNPSRPEEGFTDIGPFTDDPQRWVSFTDPWSEKQYDGFILGLSHKQQLIVEYTGGASWQRSRGALLPVPLFKSKREEYENWSEDTNFHAEIRFGSENSLNGLPSHKIDRGRSIVFEFIGSRKCNTRSGDTLVLLRLVEREPDNEDDDDKEVQDRFYKCVHDHFYVRSHLERVFGNDVKSWIRLCRPTEQHQQARDKQKQIRDFLQNFEVVDLKKRIDELDAKLRDIDK